MGGPFHGRLVALDQRLRREYAFRDSLCGDEY
jgi:hypothetical protein